MAKEHLCYGGVARIFIFLTIWLELIAYKAPQTQILKIIQNQSTIIQ
jgi:hypothetical protein